MWHSNSFGLLKGEKYGIPGFGAKMGCLNHKGTKVFVEPRRHQGTKAHKDFFLSRVKTEKE
jgi:hypothetical protein